MSDIPKSPSLNTQLANAVAEVAAAQDQLAIMSDRMDRARREESIARNNVNAAQQHFDKLVAEVKKSAPRDTEWKRPLGIPA